MVDQRKLQQFTMAFADNLAAEVKKNPDSYSPYIKSDVYEFSVKFIEGIADGVPFNVGAALKKTFDQFGVKPTSDAARSYFNEMAGVA